jgi:hypothetical protein
MTHITHKDSIRGPRCELIKPTLLENKAPTTKRFEMAHSRCLPVHELIAHLVQEGPKKNPVPNMARGIHRLNPISPWSPMLKHRPSHLTKGTIFPFYYTILTSNIGRGKLMFETQITTKDFELRVLKFSAIVASTSRLDLGQNQMSPPCQPKRRPKHRNNSCPLLQGHIISHPPSTHELDQPSPYGIACTTSLS